MLKSQITAFFRVWISIILQHASLLFHFFDDSPHELGYRVHLSGLSSKLSFATCKLRALRS